MRLELIDERQALRQEYVDSGKIALFDALKDFVDPVSTKDLPSYKEVAKQLNLSVAAVKTADPPAPKTQHRNRARGDHAHGVGRRRCRRGESELCEALIAAEGRILPLEATGASGNAGRHS